MLKMFKSFLILPVKKVRSLFWRLSNPELAMACELYLKNAELNVSSSSSVLGRITLINSKLSVGENASVSKTAVINFAGKGELKIGANVEIGEYADIGGEGKIVIGDRTTSAPHMICIGDVTIGKDTLIAPRVFLSSGSHIGKNRELIRSQDEDYFKKNGKHFSSPIIIGDDCWLGVNTVVLPGVELGHGCIVAANSVVTKSFPAFSIVGGVPAKLLKMRE